MKGNELFGIVALLVLSLLGLSALLVSLAAILPGYIRRTQAVMRKRPGRSFLIGLINAIFFLALSALIGTGFPPVAILGVFCLFIVLPICALLGLVVAAAIVGEGLWQQISSRLPTLPGTLVLGNLAIVLALLVPIVGWLFFLGLILTGLGAAISVLVQREQPEPAVEATA